MRHEAELNSDRCFPLSKASLRQIFRVSQSQRPASYFAHHRNVDSWLLEWSDDLDCLELVDATGGIAAILIGYVFDPASGAFLRSGRLALPSSVTDANSLTRHIDGLSGPFITVSSERYGGRLQVDPGAQLPVFRHTNKPIAGSSPVEVLTEAERASLFNHDLHHLMVAKEGMSSWIGGDLTAYDGLRRVLPNHYLDLTTWQTVRYWPVVDEGWLPFSEAVDRISTSLRDFVQAIPDRWDNVRLTLTAGRDTRQILAAARNVVDRVSWFTVEAPRSRQDTWAARTLAERLGLRHIAISPVSSSAEEIAWWDERVGYSMIDFNRTTFRTLEKLGEDAVVVGGLFGETGRTRFYKKDSSVINSADLTPAFLCQRMTIPMPPAVEESVQDWLDNLPPLPVSTILDLAFVELKIGCWAMGQNPADRQVATMLSPMAQRVVLDAFIRVRPEEKANNALFDAVITLNWPEAALLPFNSYGDVRDSLEVLRKITDPMRVRRFVRERFSRAPKKDVG